MVSDWDWTKHFLPARCDGCPVRSAFDIGDGLVVVVVAKECGGLESYFVKISDGRHTFGPEAHSRDLVPLPEPLPEKLFTARELVEAYEGYSLDAASSALPLGDPDVGETCGAYLDRYKEEAEPFGDGLLFFLLTELSENEGCDSRAEAARRVRVALGQLRDVLEVIEG